MNIHYDIKAAREHIGDAILADSAVRESDPIIFIPGDPVSSYNLLMTISADPGGPSLTSLVYYVDVPWRPSTARNIGSEHFIPLAALIKTSGKKLVRLTTLMLVAPPHTDRGERRTLPIELIPSILDDAPNICHLSLHGLRCIGGVEKLGQDFHLPDSLQSLYLRHVDCEESSAWLGVIPLRSEWFAVALYDVRQSQNVVLPLSRTRVEALTVVTSSHDLNMPRESATRAFMYAMAMSRDHASMTVSAATQMEVVALGPAVDASAHSLRTAHFRFDTEQAVAASLEYLSPIVARCACLRFLTLQCSMPSAPHRQRAIPIAREHPIAHFLSVWITGLGSQYLTSIAIQLMVDKGNHTTVQRALDSISCVRWNTISRFLSLMPAFTCLILELSGIGEDGRPYHWDIGNAVHVLRAFVATGSDRAWFINDQMMPGQRLVLSTIPLDVSVLRCLAPFSSQDV